MRAAEEARELRARGSYRFEVVSGMEVTTLDGHLLALFVDEPVRELHADRAGAGGDPPAGRAGGRAAPAVVADAQREGAGVRARGGGRGQRRRVLRRDRGVQHEPGRARRRRRRRERSTGRAWAWRRWGRATRTSWQAIGCARTAFEGTTAAELRRAIETKTTVAEAGRHPTMRELGYGNVALQSWRGMMATPRAMGWGPTIRSFFSSHFRRQQINLVQSLHLTRRPPLHDVERAESAGDR